MSNLIYEKKRTKYSSLSKNSRGLRNDASLIPPIRQTASIFKQPVTLFKNHKGEVRSDGTLDKPKQLFWEKRLEGIQACGVVGSECANMSIPKLLKPVGPQIKEETMLHSIATALHVSSKSITGQTASKTALDKNPGLFLDPHQPLMQNITITEDDIRDQEARVENSRKRLKELLVVSLS